MKEIRNEITHLKTIYRIQSTKKFARDSYGIILSKYLLNFWLKKLEIQKICI